MSAFHPLWPLLTTWVITAGSFQLRQNTDAPAPMLLPDPHLALAPVSCDCQITQAGQTYPISALQGTVSAPAYYSYGSPNASSANTGLEENNGLILFLYEDINTGIISLFLIADIANSGSGGSMQFELSCLPPTAYVSVQDDAGEFFGTPPVITGDWNWSACCTDGGVIEDLGCNNTFTLDLLVSSGLDSIVWLTGDIANPTHILLAMTGEAITVNCGGGGVCCPLGFDTNINVTDATCPDNADGSIDITPQDGLPPYTFNWSNGATTEDISDLMPGTYMVTVTDAQGCTEELQMDVDATLAYPPSQPASIDLCSSQPEDYFDLTSVDDVVNAGSGLPVIWFTDPGLTDMINNPSHYLTGSTIVYAVSDNGSCYSLPVEVTLTLIPSPAAFPAAMNVCEDNSGFATFDLTTMDNAVSGGTGTVVWFMDVELTDPIGDPEAFYTASTIVYAATDDGVCLSDPVEIILTVEPKPEGFPTQVSMCGDENHEAVFDLIALEPDVSGGNGSVEWYIEIELLDPVTTPDAFQTTTTTVYAQLFDGLCYSDPIPVELQVENTPIPNPITIQSCDIGNGTGLFDLTSYDAQISGGQGGVDWYLDEFLNESISNPSSFISESTVVFVVVDNGLCISDPAQIILNVSPGPVANPTSLETCADSTGQGQFNLTLADPVISGGSGLVSWFEDATGALPVATPTAYLTMGTTVYAQVSVGACISGFVPVPLTIIQSVTATPTADSTCETGGGIGLFNLTAIDTLVSGGNGQVSWYLDSMGTQLIFQPDSFPSGDTTIYARVIAGSCVSDVVPVDLSILMTPIAHAINPNICGDPAGQATINLTVYNGLISGNTDSVTWYSDSLLTMPVNNPVSFLTGDTVLYVTVFNGACTSAPASVLIHVIPQPIANPQYQEYCITQGGMVTVDLTQFDPAIGGGNIVQWYTDINAQIPLFNPQSFILSASDTVFAQATDGLCQSPVVPVELISVVDPVANTITILECGDANNEATFNLSAVEPLISNNTGIVSWFGDPGLNTAIGNINAFVTPDTTLYAIVTNGICISPAVQVQLDVTDSLVANNLTLEFCLEEMTSTVVDLTDYDLAVSGGAGLVTWYSDAAATLPISSPQAYVTTGNTVYAQVTSGSCISNIAVVVLDVATAYFPNVSCAFTSIDSVAVTWLGAADSYNITYTVNGQPAGGPVSTTQTGIGVGGLGQGDTVTFVVSSVYTSVCTIPLSETITCITDVCPAQSLSFIGLQSVYCRDEPFVALQPSPAGGLITGTGVIADTLWPALVPSAATTLQYVWTNSLSGCVYDTAVMVNIQDPLLAPAPSCLAPTLNSVSFDWTSTGAGNYGYQYQINQGAILGPLYTPGPPLNIPGLTEGDTVHLSLWAVGPAPCGNSDTVTVSCGTRVCPAASITILDPAILCTETVPVQLTAVITGLPVTPTLHWTGQAVIDPSGLFDPGLALSGPNRVDVDIDADGCLYTATTTFEIIDQPIDTPQLTCLQEDYYSIVVGWNPVPGATGYSATSTAGTGIMNGNTYSITHLQDGTNVDITLIAFDTTGCTPASTTITCMTLPIIPIHIFIPNIFSPNGDGINDQFYVQTNPEVTGINVMRIFDRWGNIVFEKFNFLPNNADAGWDGTFNGKPMNPEVYTYWVEMSTTRGKDIVKAGDVTLVR